MFAGNESKRKKATTITSTDKGYLVTMLAIKSKEKTNHSTQTVKGSEFGADLLLCVNIYIHNGKTH